ncbi:MAG: CBS domain-containing protein [Rhodospirillaceae bacterium]
MTQRKTLADVMSAGRLVCLSPETDVLTASRKLLERRSSVAAVTRDGALLGIVTERDICLRVVAAGRDAVQTRLSQIMTREPDTIGPDATLVDALEMMKANGYRHVPVEENGRVIGMISAQDLFSEIRDELQDEIRDREEFMFGSGYSLPAAIH